MDSPSSATPRSMPPSAVPPPLRQARRRRAALIAGLIVAVVVGLGVGCYFLVRALYRSQPGAAVLLHFNLSKVSAGERNGDWVAILRAVNKRAAHLGGCRVVAVGGGRIRVRFYGKTAAEIAAYAPYLAARSRLEFCLVNRFLSPETTPADKAPAGYTAMTLRTEDPAGGITASRLFVKETPELTGEAISEAYPWKAESGRFAIILRFTREGARRFAAVTRTMVAENRKTGRIGRLAIVVDERLYSAPAVREEITGGSAEISGSFTLREAVELANRLDSPLPLSGTFTLENADGSKADLTAAPRISP